ncbi:alkaline phosphatase family protein [Methylomagnum ishizawai]|uniref:alkaline phosphatase family protein n=1 Tax=Methylomagnum ishizawai TaxID=1760988 RepID=UPI001C32B8A4|nr:alkaline phosphatase family protein [Methylomagnum ishizawai]BBL73022.1 nucleotide pyrophosphatase [Methylomagnum ishizawai]
MVLPDYAGGSIVNLMASLIQGLGGAGTGYVPLSILGPQEVADYRQVVLLVVDGLGCDFLARRARRNRLGGLVRGTLTSVFPSTTAAAITTFLTGVAPQQHGLTGWHMYFRELGAVIAVLPGTPRYGGVALSQAGVDANKLFDHLPVFDRVPVPGYVAAPRRIIHSDFNLAHRGKADLRPYDGQEDFFLTLAHTLRKAPDRKFVYAYWPELDRISHEAGTLSAEADWHFAGFEEGFLRFLDYIKGTGTLVLVTADHGFIDVPEDRRVRLDDHPALAACLALPLCGEQRVAYCYVKPERCGDFEGYVRTELGHCADLLPSAELIGRGYFGLGTPHPALRDRIGDYTLVMKEDYVIKDWLPGEHRHEHIGMHGGVSAAEMRVPLIVAAA